MATETIPVDERARTPEEIERDWFENVYQGDSMKQLTPRALIMGMLLGAFMSTSNIYVGLKAGWSLGVAITSCILAFAIFATLHKLLPRLFPPFSILENNAMQSAASAAGYMTGAGLVNAIPALMMLDPAAVPGMWVLMAWILLISWLGVFLAVPAKRQMINIEQLRFPSGIAAATTLRTLHGTGGAAATRQARSLGLAMLLGLFLTWIRDAEATWMKVSEWGRGFGWTRIAPPAGSMPGWIATPLSWIQYPHIPANWLPGDWKIGKYRIQQDLTMSFEGSLLFVAAGAIMGFRQAWSLLLGTIINYGILAPMMLDAGVIPEGPGSAFRRISTWSLWIGVPMMVTSGLLLFILQWKSVVRAFSTITAMFQKRKGAGDDPMDRIEVPGTWFVVGVAVLGAVVIWMGHHFFHIHIWMGIIAVLMTFLLVVVAARSTGETDITPTGPLSKVTQLTFGALAPGNITTNLMTANITAGSCSHAGDLLTDLKSGYLLGAKPRQQFLAQFFGVLAGAVVVVPVFFLLVPNASVLGTDQWPAPAAQVWRGVAELLAKGVSALHPTARVGLVVGALAGIVLALLEVTFPKAKKFIPSPTGLGLAFTITGFYSVSMFIGALAALLLARAKPKMAEEYVVPVSSGIIAGESLMGVAIALLVVFKVLG
ncbi:MAG TPA: OPT family oligopeptide transporter [Candidatus Eisenbacteria bacterium]|nr:OPT family oligopeptide transporter [Candidatus Eisenbacteria bacterium]